MLPARSPLPISTKHSLDKGIIVIVVKRHVSKNYSHVLQEVLQQPEATRVYIQIDWRDWKSFFCCLLFFSKLFWLFALSRQALSACICFYCSSAFCFLTLALALVANTCSGNTSIPHAVMSQQLTIYIGQLACLDHLAKSHALHCS
ncbi:hypothetical protein BC830DRAFT_141653 [Chytriomyces sp. MP71]|nr:hypothetical protein BC830DRAFT_141653 [Chytriomyces sp. MP71]